MHHGDDRPGGQAGRASSTAILRFRHTAHGSGVSRTGHIRPGGRLLVEYEPARLPPNPNALTEDIMCHVRFSPGGERHSVSVLDPSGDLLRQGVPRHLPFELAVPAEATSVDLWFESRGPSGLSSWDSRYGQNYTFGILGDGLPVPEPSVGTRPTAIVDPSRIRVIEDAATKQQTRPGTGGRRLHTGLVIHVLVADIGEPIEVWADLHVFDATDELIHANTVRLQRRESGAKGTLFVWEDDVYQGSGGGSGIGVWSRPDAHTVQYRLYSQAQPASETTQAPVFTDGILHEFEVPADEDVGRIS